MADKTYDEVSDGFQTDYDIENPVTKTDGIIRMMEKKLNAAGTEEEKQELKAQMQQVSTGGVMANFQMYSQQKTVMYANMNAMAAPRVMQVQMPMMMPGVQMMAGGLQQAAGNMGFAMNFGQRPMAMGGYQMMQQRP